MKKQYIFLILLWIMLYIMYLIWNYKYKEYNIKTHIEFLNAMRDEMSRKINETEEIINYKSTQAYKNKILKEQQWLKNKWEIVVFLTSEKKYNTFTKEDTGTWVNIQSFEKKLTSEEEMIQTMTNIEKWNYYLFWKTTK